MRYDYIALLFLVCFLATGGTILGAIAAAAIWTGVFHLTIMGTMAVAFPSRDTAIRSDDPVNSSALIFVNL